MRILLIDDHGILRAGVRTLIHQAYHGAIITEAGCRQQALELIRTQAFDVIFLDLCIPSGPTTPDISRDNGLALLALLKNERTEPRDNDQARRISAPVIVMSGESQRSSIDEVMRMGASSFVPKSASHEIMLEAIHRTLQGGIYLPPEAIGRGGTAPTPDVRSLRQEDIRPITAKELGVTPREFDILRLALQGNAPWKIAAILEINPVNVRQYLSRLYAKFGVIDLYGLQGLFAKTGQVLGILCSCAPASLAARPASNSA